MKLLLPEIGPNMDLLDPIIRYAIIPLLSVLCTIVWYMYKKHDMRIELIEKRHNEMEKAIIEIKTEFRYLSRDIKEIKDLLIKKIK